MWIHRKLRDEDQTDSYSHNKIDLVNSMKISELLKNLHNATYIFTRRNKLVSDLEFNFFLTLGLIARRFEDLPVPSNILERSRPLLRVQLVPNSKFYVFRPLGPTGP